MPFLVAEGVAANLYEISVLEHTRCDGTAHHVGSTERFDLNPRAGDGDGGMLAENAGIFEEINVGFLFAADSSERFVQNELFASERARCDVEPTVFQSAFDPAHCGACGRAKQGEADGAAQARAMHGHDDGIEDHAADAGAYQPADDSVFRFLHGLADDAIDSAACQAEHCPANASRDPDCGIAERLDAGFGTDTERDVVDQVGDEIEDETEDDAQRQRKQSTEDRFASRALDCTFRNAVANAHERDDCGQHPKVGPSMSYTVDKTALTKSPTQKRTEKSGGTEIKPSLEKDAALLLGDGGRHISRFGDGAVGSCASGGRTCRAHGASGNVGNDDACEIVGGDLERRFVVIGGHRPSVACWDWADFVSNEKNPLASTNSATANSGEEPP